MNILDEIVAQRKKDIAEKSVTLGFQIPETRTRGITPFIPKGKKGVILEIKRASPSKGSIAPNLNAGETAKAYANAKTSAISVLTEEHWFKGNLEDLQNACRAVDEYASAHGTTPPAILRKDFLLSAEEIEVAYRCGADAVLLIARILDTNTMISMAKKCGELGITALIELRLEEDLQKLSEVVKVVNTDFIVCGVNARDLKNFSIDLLTPAALMQEIKAIAGENARVVFESGIRTPEAARFAGSLGFSAMLLGEAAAKSRSSFSWSLIPALFSTPLATSMSSGWNFSMTSRAFSAVIPPASQSFVFWLTFSTSKSVILSPVPPGIAPTFASIKIRGSPLWRISSIFSISSSLDTLTTA